MSAQNRLGVSLFGLLRVECDGQPIVFPTRKSRSLFAFLVLHSESHPREKLAAMFWGDSIDADALHSLRSALAAIHKALGDIFIADRETVQLNPAYALAVDVREFENVAPENPARAVELYQGDLLTEFYDDWILRERERLRVLYLDALLRLVQTHRAKSEYAHAIALAQRVLENDAANEIAHQHLMFCYLALGDRSAALAQYEKCAQALANELNVAPSQETQALYAQIQNALSESGAARVTNLPTPLTSFIGREKEIVEIKSLLQHTRLLTLTGAGGSGKTRLAIEVARILSNENCFADGVWFVEFAPLTDATLIPQTVASVLGLREEGGRPILDGLRYFLRSKQMLLLLDNCEHLIDACAQLVEALLQEAPQLKILATSREALGIAGETIFFVPSLTIPAIAENSLEALTQSEAARLFVERGVAAQPTFQVTTENASTIAQICVRVDGIPLALELAAARVKGLSVQEIAAHLDDRFRLLTGGSRTALPRQRTLQATMDWSYRLLSEQERVLLQRVSVFMGGWQLDAAECVCADEALPRADILDQLMHLVDKSLVVAETRATDTRYRLLETIRQYAQEKLDETNQAATIRDKHLDYFGELVAQLEPQIRSAAQQAALERLDADYDNVRAAIQWSLKSDVRKGFRMGWQLHMYWKLRGLFREGEQILVGLVNEPNAQAPTIERAMALNATPEIILDPVSTDVFVQEAMNIAQALDEPLHIALALSGLNINYEPPLARERLEASIAILNTIDAPWFRAAALAVLGVVTTILGDNETGMERLEEGRTVARETGDPWLIAWTLSRSGNAALLRNAPCEARAFFQESLEIGNRLADYQSIAYVMNGLGEAARAQGNYAQAMVWYDKAQRAYEKAFGDSYSVALGNKTFVAIHLKDLKLAHVSAKEAIEARRNKASAPLSLLVAMAAVAAKRFEMERAAQLTGYVNAKGIIQMRIFYPADAADYQEILDAIHAAPDQEKIQAAWERGAAMTREEAIALALEESTVT